MRHSQLDLWSSWLCPVNAREVDGTLDVGNRKYTVVRCATVRGQLFERGSWSTILYVDFGPHQAIQHKLWSIVQYLCGVVYIIEVKCLNCCLIKDLASI